MVLGPLCGPLTWPVRITYNEDSNVIMTVTVGASQLRGSELFYIGSCFLGTDQWV